MKKFCILIILMLCSTAAWGARTTNVVTRIYAGGFSTNVGVHSVSWAGDNGTINLSNSIPSDVVAGDIVRDLNGNSYLITALGTTNLTCQDFNTNATPVLGTGTIFNAYNTITLWEADLDDTVLYQSNDVSIGECYDDGGAFNEKVILDGGDTVGLLSATITVPVGERHDGTAGSGARLVRADTGRLLEIEASSSGPLLSCDWLEIDGNGGQADPMVQIRGAVNTPVRLSKMLIHDSANNFGNDMIGVFYSVSGCYILNCIIYDITHENTGAYDLFGIKAHTTGRPDNISNTTLYGVTKNGGSGNAYGISVSDDASNTNQNCIVMGVSGGAAAADWNQTAYTNAVVSYNMSEDASASGTGSLINKVAANQFVSIVGGSEDLHLKSSADAIMAGVDLGTSPTGVNIDIDGRDRDASADIWDIGADQSVGMVRRRIITITGR